MVADPELAASAGRDVIYLSGIVKPDLPAMVTPMMGNRVPDGQPWAADTGCFAAPERHDDERYLTWLRSKPLDRCLFATAPDVVGDAEATLARSLPMLPRIRALGVPAALVAQDGLDRLVVPWDSFDVLFVGGTTAWKLSEASHSLVAEAKRRGKWVHMGRVNSLKRLRLAKSIGCDSADGTFLKWAPNHNRGRMDRWFADLDTNPLLWMAA